MHLLLILLGMMPLAEQVELRSDAGTLVIDFPDGEVDFKVRPGDRMIRELQFEREENSVRVSHGRHRIHMQVQTESLHYEENVLLITKKSGHQIRITVQPKENDGAVPDTQPSEPVDSVKTAIPDILLPPLAPRSVNKPVDKLGEFRSAVEALARLSPEASYLETETVLLNLAMSLPPNESRRSNEEAILRGTAANLLFDLIEKGRSASTSSAVRLLSSPGDATNPPEATSTHLMSVTIAVDLLGRVSSDSSRLRTLLETEMQHRLGVLPQADGPFGWSGWKLSVTQHMVLGNNDFSAGDAAVAAAGKEPISDRMAHLNTVLRVWENTTGKPMVFHHPPETTLSHFFDHTYISNASASDRYRFLPQITAVDGLPLDHWRNVALRSDLDLATYERLMVALRAGRSNATMKAPFAKAYEERFAILLADFEPTESWFGHARAVLAAGVSLKDAERFVSLIREQPLDVQAEIFSNVVTRRRTIRAHVSQDEDSSDTENGNKTNWQVLESPFVLIQDDFDFIYPGHPKNPLTNLIHERLSEFDSLPDCYQDSLMTVLSQRPQTEQSREFLNRIIADQTHPRRLEAAFIRIQNSSTNDPDLGPLFELVWASLQQRQDSLVWLDSLASASDLQIRDYTIERALRMVDLIKADSESGDIRPMKVRVPVPLVTNAMPAIPGDYVAGSSRVIGLSRRAMLIAELSSPPPQSQGEKDRLAIALANAVPQQFLNPWDNAVRIEEVEGAMFRLGNRFRLDSPEISDDYLDLEIQSCRQALERTMRVLLGTDNWRERLKVLKSE